MNKLEKLVYEKAARDRWTSLGLCSRCGKPKDDPEKKTCLSCRKRSMIAWNGMGKEKREKTLEKQRIRMRKRLEYIKSNGICSTCYKNKCEVGKSSCKSCIPKILSRARIRIDSGICICCNNPAVRGRYCQECLLKKYINTKKKLRDSKIDALAYLGNKCSKCGIIANKDNYPIFDFHHLDKKAKEFKPSSILYRSPLTDKIKKELDKCVIMCANCHRMEHNTRGEI